MDLLDHVAGMSKTCVDDVPIRAINFQQDLGAHRVGHRIGAGSGTGLFRVDGADGSGIVLSGLVACSAQPAT